METTTQENVPEVKRLTPWNGKKNGDNKQQKSIKRQRLWNNKKEIG